MRNTRASLAIAVIAAAQERHGDRVAAAAR